MTRDQVTRIFVYGTLRRDPTHEMFHLLAKHARFAGQAAVAGRLFDLGAYPGMIAPDDTGVVVGELYEFDEAAWSSVIARLDEYEGCSSNDPEPHEYRREIVTARLADGSMLPAWAYVLNQRPAQVREIESGDYPAWRTGT